MRVSKKWGSWSWSDLTLGASLSLTLSWSVHKKARLPTVLGAAHFSSSSCNGISLIWNLLRDLSGAKHRSSQIGLGVLLGCFRSLLQKCLNIPCPPKNSSDWDWNGRKRFSPPTPEIQLCKDCRHDVFYYGRVLSLLRQRQAKYNFGEHNSHWIQRFYGPHRPPGRDLSEFLADCDWCAKATSASFAAELCEFGGELSESLFQNRPIQTVLRPCSTTLVKTEVGLKTYEESETPKRQCWGFGHRGENCPKTLFLWGDSMTM